MLDKIISISAPPYLLSKDHKNPVLNYLTSLGACTLTQSDILQFLYEKDPQFAKECFQVKRNEDKDSPQYYIGDYGAVKLDQKLLRERAWTIIGDFYETRIQQCQESVLYIESVSFMDFFLIENMDWMLYWLVEPESKHSKEYLLRERDITEGRANTMQRVFDWNGEKYQRDWREEESDYTIEYDERDNSKWQSKVKRLFESNQL